MTTIVRRSSSSRTVRIVLPTVTALAILGVWEFAGRTGAIPSRYAPSPSTIAVNLAQLLGTAELWQDIAQTLLGWALSLLIASIIGIAAGLLLGSSRLLSAFFAPVVAFLRPIPSIAVIPIAVLLIGSGKQTEVSLATYAALWQMLIAALAAVGGIDPIARDTAAAYSLPRLYYLRRVVLVSMMPALATGLRIASATALIFCITSELLIGSPGLGSGLSNAREVGNLPKMYAYIFVIGILGTILTAALQAIERRALFWEPGRRTEATR